MEKLKKCPFCGGEAHIIGGKTEDEVAWVVCIQCYAESAVLDSKQDAAKAWNRRVNEWLIL